jgi:hypothetical protein
MDNTRTLPTSTVSHSAVPHAEDRLFDLIRPAASFAAQPAARKLQLASLSALAALVFAAAWGAAAGSMDATLALGNLVKVPMVVLLSTLTAAPLGVVAWKLFGGDARASDLLLAFARGLLVGSVVLGTLVPIVAIYYHSSTFAGPVLAVSTALGSLAIGGVLFVCFVLRLPGNAHRAVRVGVPLGMLTLQTAALIQMVAIASPILPDETMFRRGIDGFTRQEAP